MDSSPYTSYTTTSARDAGVRATDVWLEEKALEAAEKIARNRTDNARQAMSDAKVLVVKT